ncbi:unknown [Crocosphaera subtropica ATCC 51142]|uniref:Sulfotransferase domain-containing protein n=1 Tax=Crocosphaera subtropica (strain ATCC 51142 / BH68) TaxID=43989 RepID=B1WWK4_CROS5|nr:hypothetical protein [Crocosphaera subtropica]ACB50728.1 unknown [Crocosphaera subtropica ATCC 51142]
MNFIQNNDLGTILNFYRTKKKDIFTDFEQLQVFLKNYNQSPVIGKSIRIIGMRRSGNHAIINWLLGQVPKDTIFLNDLKPGLRQFRQGRNTRFFKKLRKVLEQNYFKDIVIHSYEDIELSSLSNPYYNLMRLIYLGKAQKNIDILILRDPYNTIASRIKATQIESDYTLAPMKRWSAFKDKNDTNYRDFYYKDFMMVENPHLTPLDLWIQYAKEFIGETNFLKTKICLNFNRWFSDSLYRQELAEELQVNFTDSNLNKVATYGKGSSFDGNIYDGNAQTMNLLERWQYYRHDHDYLSILKSKELEYYSQKIFNFVPF